MQCNDFSGARHIMVILKTIFTASLLLVLNISITSLILTKLPVNRNYNLQQHKKPQQPFRQTTTICTNWWTVIIWSLTSFKK